MDVDAAADIVRYRLWREHRAMAEAMRRRARHLAGDHRVIGGGQGRLRRHRHLELARTVFGKKTVRHRPRGAQRRNKRFAETPLAAKGAERVGVARTVLHAGIQKFLLEGSNQTQAGRLVQVGCRAAQKVARAAFPRLAVGRANVAQKEMLDRRSVGKVDPHLSRRIGHDHQIAGGPKRRVPDRTGRRHHQIAARPANALLEPPGQFARRKPLAAYMPGDVASRDKNQLFPDHRIPRYPTRGSGRMVEKPQDLVARQIGDPGQRAIDAASAIDVERTGFAGIDP